MEDEQLDAIAEAIVDKFLKLFDLIKSEDENKDDESKSTPENVKKGRLTVMCT